MNENVIPQEDFIRALDAARQDPETAKFYDAAPPGARQFLCLYFYSTMPEFGVSEAKFWDLIQEIDGDLTVQDARYLLGMNWAQSVTTYLKSKMPISVKTNIPPDGGYNKGLKRVCREFNSNENKGGPKMVVKCPYCNNELDISVELCIGQHIVCPYCNRKFSYGVNTSQEKPAPGRTIAGKKVLLFSLAGVASLIISVAIISMSGLFDKEKVDLDAVSVDPMTCSFDGTLYDSGDDSSCFLYRFGFLPHAVGNTKIGNAYYYAGYDFIKVDYVMPKRGVLASAGKDVIYVATDRSYINSENLKEGLYTCVGRAAVTKANGERIVVRAFREVDKEIGKRRMEMILRQVVDAEKKKKEAEEDARVARAEQEIRLNAERNKAEADLKAQKEANDRKLEQIRAEQNRRAEAERIARQHKAELERIAEEKKLAEEAKKRYPIEQKKWEEYAAMKFGTVNFGIEPRFLLSRSARRSLKAFQINEKKWYQIKQLILQKQWLKVLSLLMEKDMVDYPAPGVIDAAFNTLLSKEFHFEMRFEGPNKYYSVFTFFHSDESDILTSSNLSGDWKLEYVGKFQSMNLLPHAPDIKSEDGNGVCTVLAKIRLKDSYKILLLDNYPSGKCSIIEEDEKFRMTVDKLEGDLKKGRLERSEYEAQVSHTYKDCLKRLLNQVYPLEPSSDKPAADADAKDLKDIAERVITGFSQYKFGQIYPEKRMTRGMWTEGSIAIKSVNTNFLRFDKLELGYAINGKKLCMFRFVRNFQGSKFRDADIKNVLAYFEKQYGIALEEVDNQYVFEDSRCSIRLSTNQATRKSHKSSSFNLSKSDSLEEPVTSMRLEIRDKRLFP